MKPTLQSLLFALCSFSVFALHAHQTLDANEVITKQSKPEKWVIFGGTRGIGFSVAHFLNEKIKEGANISCSLVVHDSTKAAKYFSGTAITWHQSNSTALKTITKEADYIVVAATFPYKIWEKKYSKTD